MSDPLDLALYLVTDTHLTANRGLGAVVEEAVRGGVTAVQLRDHEADDDEFLELARRLRRVLDGTGVPLLLNDRIHLVEAASAQGAHIGQHDRNPEQARAELGPTAYLGLSIGTSDELMTATQLPPGTLNYLGLGPVWSTPTKPDHDSPIGTDGLRRLTRASPWPCVAIGGITLGRIPQLAGSGAAGIAVVSEICAAADVTAATAQLGAAWSEVSE